MITPASEEAIPNADENSAARGGWAAAGTSFCFPFTLLLPGGAIFLFDGADDQLRLSASWGLPAETRPTDGQIPAEAFHCDCVIRQGPIDATDAKPAAAFFASRLNILLPEWPHNLCVPLLAQGKIQGVLDLFKHSPDGFSPNEIRLFKALGHEIGVAAHNARLYQAELQARQTAEVLGTASVAKSSGNTGLSERRSQT